MQTKLLTYLIPNPMETIWGEIQTSHHLADGVVDVCTASHGGIIVDKYVAKNFLSTEAKQVATYENGHYYFEEDCNWAVFAFENPTIVPQNWLQYIEDCLNRWNQGYIDDAKRNGNYEKRLLKLHEIMGLPTPVQTALFN